MIEDITEFAAKVRNYSFDTRKKVVTGDYEAITGKTELFEKTGEEAMQLVKELIGADDE